MAPSFEFPLLTAIPVILVKGSVIVIKLILIDFDGHNANITLKICTHVEFNTCLCCVKILVSFLSRNC